MRLCASQIAASFILLAACVLALEDINVTVDKGSNYVAAVETKDHEVDHCYLITPTGKIIGFNPDDHETRNHKYDLNVSTETKCSVNIKNLDENDNGIWILKYDYEEDQTEKQVFHIKVTSDIIRSGSYRPVQYEKAERYTTVLGASHLIVINIASFSTNEACFVVTPSGVTHTLTSTSQIPGIQVITGNGIECGVVVTVTQDSIGEWTLVGWSNFLSQPIERRLPFTIYVEGMVTEPDTGKRTLQQIDQVTRIGGIFDISLSKTATQEECFLTTPDGQTVALASAQITGVTVRDSSNYVNCRVTVGPMEERLLGIWSLCGRSGSIERCQPVNVTWYSSDDPSAEWELNMRPHFDYSVNFGGIINPSVTGFGELLTCQVITPTGEDIALTGDTEYPGLERTSLDLSSVCSVLIGPIDASMLGDWVLYAKVHSPFFGFVETRLPFTFNLYNNDDPYAQAYNVTELDPINRIVNLGNTITVEVKGTGSVDGCYYTTPAGLTYSSADSKSDQGVIFENVGSIVACRVIIGPITETMLGQWQVIGKFSRERTFTELRQSVNIIKEDPENPIEDEDRRIDILNPQTFNTELGARHIITIPLHSFTTVESCHIRTPEGLQYKLMDGFNLPGIVIEEINTAACGISLTVENEDMVGEWTLISRVNIISQPVEQRLTFTVHVEENVEAFPSELTIIEGNDLYVRLMEPTPLVNTCHLVGPYENISPEIDTFHETSCGFIVRNIGISDTGEWEIVYGEKIIYKAQINVTVIEKEDVQIEEVVLYKHSTVNLTIGPESLVYCRLQDPQGITVFEGFGKCNLVIERVLLEHEGFWTMSAGLLGQIVVNEYKFQVIVIDGDDTPTVITRVEKQRPEVLISCKMSNSDPVRTCKFRDPDGAILLASQGVGQYRYTFHGTEVGLESELSTYECGLRITNPTTADLGLWRCALETDSGTYYGFLPVLCPWALQDPEVQAIVTTEPILKAERPYISAMEEDSVTMSCSIQAPIRYCYFRRQNGTTFSVGTATSTPNMDYVGAGFAAGECGVRFKNLAEADSGSWSCHVGLEGDGVPEQRADFVVDIKPSLTAWLGFNSHNELVLKSQIAMPGTLEYCRFVRMDGTGFTSQNIPVGYTFIGDLKEKLCAIRMAEPTILNVHPWVIGAKLVGMDVEITRMTTDNLLTIPGDPEIENPNHTQNIFLFVLVCLLSVLIILVLFTFVPKLDKKWVSDRMNSFRKKPEQHVTA